jgi:hypothetical protein
MDILYSTLNGIDSEYKKALLEYKDTLNYFNYMRFYYNIGAVCEAKVIQDSEDKVIMIENKLTELGNQRVNTYLLFTDQDKHDEEIDLKNQLDLLYDELERIKATNPNAVNDVNAESTKYIMVNIYNVESSLKDLTSTYK